jgi:chloramphenicol-sensitive protein RarD
MRETGSEPRPGEVRRTGVLCIIGAYGSWGLFPLYFKALTASPLEVLAQRVLWSAIFLAGILCVQRRWAWLGRVVQSRPVLLRAVASASLLSVNWFIYIWAVDSGRVVDASLGYFITPLVSVVLGVLLLNEALRLGQWLALGMAASGVLWLTLQFGGPPWVGLGLALSFGSYGALRKTGSLGALEGLMLETLLMLPLALAVLVWLGGHGQNEFLTGSAGLQTLLVCVGPLTAVPLLLFAAGARRIPLSLVGVLQYISPTLQLLLGVWLWHEPFNQTKAIGYALIWLALLIYSGEALWASKARRRASVVMPLNGS